MHEYLVFEKVLKVILLYVPGWALEISTFFGSQMALAYRLDAIPQGPKKSRFPGPSPLPLAQVMDAARITHAGP